MKREMRKHVYGHKMTAKQIMKQHPYNDRICEIDKYISLPSYTITFDVYLAYELMRKGYPVVVWGELYEGKRIFIFKKNRKSIQIFGGK